ncbi:MAG TPA: outer membrane beta-barrel protein [Puia sp.]|nr:outer membrane beta-barrel protein [Puia sp.]
MKESNFYSDEFEHLIREKTEQYKMYPSENVWKGVHNSLHTKRKWFIGSMAFLVTGILFLSGRELIAPSGHSAVKKLAAAGGPLTEGFGTDLSRTNQPDDNSLTSFVRLRPANAANAAIRHNTTTGNGSGEEADQSFNHFVITISDPVVSQPDLSEFLSHAVRLPGQAPSLIATREVAVEPATKPVADEHAEQGLLDSWLVRNAPESPAGRKGIDGSPVRNGAEGLRESADGSRESAEAAGSREAGHESESDDAAARSVLESLSARGQRAHSNGPLAGTKSARHRTSVAGDVLQDSAGAGSRASAAAIGEATDFSKVNWLHDYAMYTLPPTPTRGRLFLQYIFTPTINYRTLSGGYFNAKELGSPTALMHPGNVQNWADNSPELGFEFGGNLLYRVTRNLTVKGGLQFNFSRYRILDSLASDPTAGNFGGKTRETLYNNYFQLSAPIGFELRVLGNERLQFNLGATIQPFYLLNTNPYMLTTDNNNNASYTKDPSLLRRWNVSGALEAFLSYQAGPIRWQIGPEFRYQLLSTYNSGYPINENLKGYGIKIGITKPLP